MPCGRPLPPPVLGPPSAGCFWGDARGQGRGRRHAHRHRMQDVWERWGGPLPRTSWGGSSPGMLGAPSPPADATTCRRTPRHAGLGHKAPGCARQPPPQVRHWYACMQVPVRGRSHHEGPLTPPCDAAPCCPRSPVPDGSSGWQVAGGRPARAVGEAPEAHGPGARPQKLSEMRSAIKRYRAKNGGSPKPVKSSS